MFSNSSPTKGVNQPTTNPFGRKRNAESLHPKPRPPTPWMEATVKLASLIFCLKEKQLSRRVAGNFTIQKRTNQLDSPEKLTVCPLKNDGWKRILSREKSLLRGYVETSVV